MMTASSSIAEAQRLGRTFFDLDFPCTLAVFKGAFRKAAKALHTDTSGGDTKDQFGDMHDAYEKILTVAQKVPGFFAEPAEGGGTGTVPTAFLTTVDGTLLAELGLGLGPTKNGSDCPECQHKGYSESFERTYVVCNSCDKDGHVRTALVLCRECKGTGISLGSRRYFRCIRCRGTGKDPGYTVCTRCRGTKTIWSKEDGMLYRKCYKCNGFGELPMFNPVIIKGALSR